MKIAELIEASEKANATLLAYREAWEKWRSETTAEMAAHRRAIASLEKEMRHLNRLHDTIEAVNRQIDDVTVTVDAMGGPLELPTEFAARPDPIEVPSGLEEIAGALMVLSRPQGLCGVYFLVRGNTVVYVGQSVNIGGRMVSHCAADKSWDRVFVLETDPGRMLEVEARFIQKLKPEYNRSMPFGF